MTFLNKENNTEKFKLAAKQEAMKRNVSDEVFNAKFEQAKEHFKEKNYPENELDFRAYKKITIDMKGLSNQNSKYKLNTYSGVIFFRRDLRDFDGETRAAALEYVEEHGLEEAIAKKIVNEKGKPIYVNNPIGRKGVIPRDTRTTLFLGLLQKPDSDQADIFEIYANRDKTDLEIPLFKQISIDARDTKNADRVTLESYNGDLMRPLDINKFIKHLTDTYSDRIVEFDALSHKKVDAKEWVITEGHIVRQGETREDADTPIDVMSSDITSDEFATFWVNKAILKDLGNMEEKDALIILRPYVPASGNNEGQLNGNIYGICPEGL